MQSDPRFYPKKAAPSLVNEVGNNYMNVPLPSSFAGVLPSGAKPLMPPHGIEFQTSEVCPKNFIIFDQTDHRSQIMFHPAIAHKFCGAGINMYSTYMQDIYEKKDADHVEREVPSTLKEDSDDIDALLSSEEDEQEEYDEEEVSTARTYGNYGSNSASDSCSNYAYKTRKNGCSSVQRSSSSHSNCNSEKKRQKLKKMVKGLRGIVPGGDQMNTATVLDEAVRYLKSLKVEVKKLGIGNLNS